MRNIRVGTLVAHHYRGDMGVGTVVAIDDTMLFKKQKVYFVFWPSESYCNYQEEDDIDPAYEAEFYSSFQDKIRDRLGCL